MRIASFNLQHGRSLHDGRVLPERLQEAVRLLAPDVLGLQEVDSNQPRSDGRHLTQEVAEEMGAADWRFVPALVGTPGVEWRHAHDEDVGAEMSYGCSLVSRYPVREWHVVRLPAPSVPGRRPTGAGRIGWLLDEPRVGVAAVIEAPFGVMTVATTHLSLLQGWNMHQLRRLCRAVERLPAPQIVMGDLNMPPPLPRLATGWRPLVSERTFPGPKPRLQLDHVLARGDLPPVRSVQTHALSVSDHRAVVLEL